MLTRRNTDENGAPTYEIRTVEWALSLSAREVCQLACAIESLFRDQREQLIEDVCHESTQECESSLDFRERQVRTAIAVQRN